MSRDWMARAYAMIASDTAADALAAGTLAEALDDAFGDALGEAVAGDAGTTGGGATVVCVAAGCVSVVRGAAAVVVGTFDRAPDAVADGPSIARVPPCSAARGGAGGSGVGAGCSRATPTATVGVADFMLPLRVSLAVALRTVGGATGGAASDAVVVPDGEPVV